MGLRASSRSAPTGPGKTLALTPLRRLPGHACSLCQASVTSFCLTKGLWGPGEETKESSSRGGCFTHMTTKGREGGICPKSRRAHGAVGSTDRVCVSRAPGSGPSIGRGRTVLPASPHGHPSPRSLAFIPESRNLSRRGALHGPRFMGTCLCFLLVQAVPTRHSVPAGRFSVLSIENQGPGSIPGPRGR